jgi:hypothetical protein
VASSPDNGGVGGHCQTAQVRQARSRGVTKVNQWLNLLHQETGSNLVDMGRPAVRADPTTGKATRTSAAVTDYEATVNACGVAVARPQEKSWAPIRPSGAWGT